MLGTLKPLLYKYSAKLSRHFPIKPTFA